jgi:DNA-binding PadR family transcriptional regulator
VLATVTSRSETRDDKAVPQTAASQGVGLLSFLVAEPQLSLTDFAVLGLLAEGPSHGFALSKALGPEGPVGRILTVRRPLAYRALARLVELGLVEPVHTEPGDAGPQRVIHRITTTGGCCLSRWLLEPVAHVRDLRIGFQLKLVFLHRSGTSPLELIKAQRRVLQPTLSALDSSAEEVADDLELWRQHNAVAAAAYLDHLQARYGRS